MAESIIINKKLSKEEFYQSLVPQIKVLIEGETDLIANMANVSAVLKEAMNWLWVGFYIVKDNQLVLGPFQGPLACTRIEYDKGVCGKAWSTKTTLIVPDVDNFPGHIACSSLSKSEIVIPAVVKNEVKFVLDIDSETIGNFDETDRKYLEMIVAKLASVY
ncbi:MAG: GAF domain-containing protein [Vicingaceae bacterium]